MSKAKPVLTAYTGNNNDLFEKIASLYIKDNDRVLDMTFGKGIFWKNIPDIKCEIWKNDIDKNLGTFCYDFRELPEDWKAKFHVVVFDPPYMHSSKYKTIKKSIDDCYKNNAKISGAGSMNSVRAYYKAGMLEAHRVLASKGILIVKCMDQIESSKQRRLHIWVWEDALNVGFMDEDLFVLVQQSVPAMRWQHQIHARKNNSFFWVFRRN